MYPSPSSLPSPPPAGDYGLDLFVCGDQLLRGAALNAVIIAEKMLL